MGATLTRRLVIQYAANFGRSTAGLQQSMDETKHASPLKFTRLYSLSKYLKTKAGNNMQIYLLCSYPPHSMLWLNVSAWCLLSTNILSSTSPVSATVPRRPGRGTFLHSISWPGGKAAAGQSPPRRSSFPPNVATTGTSSAHLATWGPA